MKPILTLLLVFTISFSFAQLPETDIYVLDIGQQDGALTFSNPVNITNRAGYDNQPYFVGDSVILYTASRDSQTDIYQYNLKSKQLTQITKTPESEYSPQIAPDKVTISVVRVEMDHKTQRVYKYNLDGTNPKMVWSNPRVGYYCWMNSRELASFILGDSAKKDTNHLEIFNTIVKKTTERFNYDIGRTVLKRTDKEALTFIRKLGEQWWIENLDWKTFQLEEIVATLPEQEDYCWTTDGSLLMGKDGKLYQFTPGKDEYDWRQVADFTGTDYANFYRLAVSPSGNKLAIVVFSGKKP